MYQLSEQIKLIKVADPTADGTTAVNSTSIDMWAHGARGVMFLTSFGTAAANNTILVAQSADDSTFADLADTTVASNASDEDVWIDVYQPAEQYVRAEIARGTSTTVGDVWAILYGLRHKPADNTTTGTITGAYADNPAEA
jgi:hypothetical protein